MRCGMGRRMGVVRPVAVGGMTRSVAAFVSGGSMSVGVCFIPSLCVSALLLLCVGPVRISAMLIQLRAEPAHLLL